MKSSSNHNYSNSKNRRPLYTSPGHRGDDDIIQGIHVSHPLRKRSKIDYSNSPNLQDSSPLKKNNDAIFKSNNSEVIGITSTEKLDDPQQAFCPETTCLTSGFQQEYFGRCLNVRRKGYNFKTLMPDPYKSTCNGKEIADDQYGKNIDTCVKDNSMSSQASLPNVFASSTSASPVSPLQIISQSSEMFSMLSESQRSDNLFSDFLDDSDSNFAELDVSGIVSSYNSASKDLENQEPKACSYNQTEVEVTEQLNVNSDNNTYNTCASKDPNGMNSPTAKQVGNFSKTAREVCSEIKNKQQAKETNKELFYGLPLKVGNLIKKHKGIGKLYGM